MKILKNGNTIHKYNGKCPNCGCEFVAYRSETYTFATPIGLVARCGVEHKVYRFCDCPECGKMVGVNEKKEHEQNKKENDYDNDGFLHCTRLKDCPQITEEILKMNAVTPQEIVQAYMDIEKKKEEDNKPKCPFRELLEKIFRFTIK